ncbi:TIGR01244 family sulfur transferase [Brevundimonas sp.]|uniref:TIGR01244 family sulfur transferase n=1 Tax=Brevundimonas sp. TaxID=1871086 RepID=UPI003F730C86
MKKLSASVTIAGQLSPTEFSHLKQLGYAAVVNHRPDHEEPGQPTSQELSEAALVSGLTYVWIPVSGMPDRAAVEATAAALEGASESAPVFMFCRSGMRSTAAWAMAERARGVDADELRAAAAAAGYDLSRLPL